MSSIETPPDPDDPEPTREQMVAAGRDFLMMFALLIAIAIYFVWTGYWSL